VLVNNAGIGYFGSIEESDIDEVRRMFEINVWGLVQMTRAVLPDMRKHRAGTIVNVSSMGGLAGFAATGFYHGTKFAVEGLSESLAAEVAPLGIHVLLVEPGPFRTDWAGRSASEAPQHIADYKETVGVRIDSVKRNGVLDQVKAALTGRTVFEFGGIEVNPAYLTLRKAIDLGRAERVDFLLAVGGGSVVDGTKFIAAGLKYDGDPWDIMDKRRFVVHAAVPMACVLTLPATGSEMNAGAVISRPETGDKLDFHSPNVLPRFSVLDPETTYTLPPRQIGNGVVDAFVHTVEQYLTYPVGAKVQDRFAEGLLLTLIEDGPAALERPQNYAVRANIMWAATMALNALIGLGMPQDWATPYDRPRTDRQTRPRPRPEPRRGAALATTHTARQQAGQAVTVRRTGLESARWQRGVPH